MQKILSKSKEFYESCLKEHGEIAKGLNWKNKKTQYLRFEILTSIGNINKKSIHDLGCGFGDYLIFLKNKHRNFHYLGSDISNKMINIAKKLNNKNNFIVRDFFCSKFNSSYLTDYVIASGLFSVKNNFSNQTWENYIFHGTKQMFKYAKQGIGFNVMSSAVDFKDKNLFYMNINKLLNFLERNLSPKIKVITSYNLWEYTVFVYK